MSKKRSLLVCDKGEEVKSLSKQFAAEGEDLFACELNFGTGA